MADIKTRLKDQRRAITIVLLIVAILILATSFFIRDNETADLLRGMGCGFLLATIIFRVFKVTFGRKPTREKVEEEIFEKKN